MLETGSPVHHVQQQLGHADRRTTLNHYTGATDARQRRKAGRVRMDKLNTDPGRASDFAS
jgi:integrase